LMEGYEFCNPRGMLAHLLVEMGADPFGQQNQKISVLRQNCSFKQKGKTPG
jgi:hypothetical protein